MFKNRSGCNRKQKRYTYAHKDRQKNMRAYVLKFFRNLDVNVDVRHWVEFTDKFCKAIVAKDATVLKPNVLHVL